MNPLIQKVRVLDPLTHYDQVADVLIIEGRIETITSKLKDVPKNVNILNGQGLVLAPGLVDLYSYSGEPGHEERETLATLGKSAIAGGFTRLSILPNTVPPIDNPATLSLLQNTPLSFSPSPSLSFWGALTMGAKDAQMTELGELVNAGVVGFSNGCPINNLTLLRRLLEYVSPLNKPVALMAVNSQLRGNGVMREGVLSIRCGLPGDPTMSETTALASILEMVEATATPVHLMRISTARGVELIASAKQRGVPVTASTTWMHLLLDTETVSHTYNPNLHLNPPLGNPVDREALVMGVREGIIDAIAVDHTPYTYEEKTVAFAEAPAGAIGLELALPLLWQTFVETKQWSPLQLWQALSVKPSQCLQQSPIKCQEGEKAELVLFDPSETWTVSRQNLKSLSDNTFWYGKEIKGKVVRVWNNE